MREDFLKIIIRNDGRICPKKANEAYFIKHGQRDLWDWFLEYTKIFSTEPITHRLIAVKENHTQIKYCRICDKPAMFARSVPNGYSNYCSAKCSHHESQNKSLARSKVNEIAANAKRKQTLKAKYGYEYNSQRPEIKELLSKPKIPEAVLQKLNDRDWLHEQYTVKKRSSVDIAVELNNIHYGTVLFYLRKHGIEISYIKSSSAIEHNLIQFLQSKGIQCEQANRTAIKPYEIDIYIPEKKLGIELNGLYFHSLSKDEENKKTINRHRDKFILAEQQGIKLLQFTDDETSSKIEIVKSMILNALGSSERKLDARKLSVRSVPKTEYKQFCEFNHISGYAKAQVTLGLYEGQELISVLSFAKSRFDKNYEWEIIRFCSRLNTSVRGGFSRLLSHFMSEHQTRSICSYSDLSYGNGSVYANNGFNLIKTTDVGYFWTDGHTKINRYLTQKKRLQNLLGNDFDSSKSESENMFNAGYGRYWNCGNRVFGLQ